MRKFWALLGSAVFFVIAPGTLAGFLPWAISRGEMQPALFGQDWLRIVGGVLVFLGLVPLLNSFLRFALEGLGTPAPIAPPQHLVVTGFYRHVRNPMYVGVVAIVLGEALLLGAVALLWYAAVVWLGFHLFVLGYEEPTLDHSFGDEYKTYRENVPRWLPRLMPWRQTAG
ncbi:MAG: isoprenylcysteine carboxylmethyltransferase family protein [Micropepsaceae bacterium]